MKGSLMMEGFTASFFLHGQSVSLFIIQVAEWFEKRSLLPLSFSPSTQTLTFDTNGAMQRRGKGHLLDLRCFLEKQEKLCEYCECLLNLSHSCHWPILTTTTGSDFCHFGGHYSATRTMIRIYTRLRLYGLRIDGLFGYISVIWSLENVFLIWNFRNMVILDIWSVFAGPHVDHISGTECTSFGWSWSSKACKRPPAFHSGHGFQRCATLKHHNSWQPLFRTLERRRVWVCVSNKLAIGVERERHVRV